MEKDQGMNYMERELQKEVDKNQARYKRSCKEIRSLIDDISFFNDENKKLDKVFFKLISDSIRYGQSDQRGTRLYETLQQDIFFTKQSGTKAKTSEEYSSRYDY